MAKSKKTLRQAANGRPVEQVAALPFRRGQDGEVEILIMTSRETQRAVIPKGWPMKNRKDWKSAEIEARQEAGVVGDVGRKRIGQYLYWKRMDNFFALAKVAVYPLAVRRQLDDWPERHERAQIWVTAEEAALLLDEPDLGALVLEFAQSPAALRMLPRRAPSATGATAAP